MADEKLGREAAKAAALGAIKASASHITTVWIIPIALPAVAAYLGYAQHLPWMYIAVGVGLMFAGITTGLVRFDEWRERKRIEGKLHFSEFRVLRSASLTGGFVLGIALNNEADVKMDVDFAQIRTGLEDKVPKLREFKKTRFTVAPHNVVYFDDHSIDIAAPTPGTLEATLDFVVRYGPVGNLKYTLPVKKRATIPFDENGLPRGKVMMYDAA